MNFVENIKNACIEKPWAVAIDILLIALLTYLLIAFLKKNHLTRLVKWLMFAAVLSVVLSSEFMGLTLTGKVASYAALLFIVLLITLFPQEMRRGVLRAGSPKEMEGVFTTQYNVSDDALRATISEIARAVQNMSKKDVGALIVIAPNVIPNHILESGTKLDSIVSCQLLESIFNTKAPLHDGAVFIRGNRILAAGCFLPLSQSQSIDKELGTRHRAAIGVTENYNVLSIMVSEETGVISVAEQGILTRYYDTQMLNDVLEQAYGLRGAHAKKIKTKRVKNKEQNTEK